MLRQCIQGAGRRRFRQQQWSPSSSSALPYSSLASSDDDNASKTDVTRKRTAHHHHPSPHHSLLSTTIAARPAIVVSKRCFSISRHPDPLVRHGTINTLENDDAEVGGDADGNDNQLLTADDLEFDEDDNAMSRKMNEDSSLLWDDEHPVGGGKSGGGDDYSDIFGISSMDDGGDDDEDDEELSEEAKEDAARLAKQKEIQAELDTRTGRLWSDDWIITDEEWMADTSFDDIEEWKPTNATRKSLQSVKVFEKMVGEEMVAGVPTLGEMAQLEGKLPKMLPSHPGHGTPGNYAKFRKRQIKSKLKMAIQLSIHIDLKKILKMESWEEKQEAVDGLFEVIGDRVKEREPVLGKLPDFGNMVENGLEEVLNMVQGKMRGVEKEMKKEMNTKKTKVANDDESSTEKEGSEGVQGEGGSKEYSKEKAEEVVDVMGVSADPPTPIFMDILAAANQLNEQQQSDDTTTISPFFAQSNDDGVPNLLYPLKNHHNDGVGRMTEEWQLAANKETKRIMMRDATREIASNVVDAAHCCEGEVEDEKKGAARVLVTGNRGVGKTATLASLVASARLSGHIVVYLPDGDRLRKHGFYIEPCNHRKGLYNLPEIGKEFCEQLLTSHGHDIKALPPATVENMKGFFTEDQIRRLFKRAYKEDESVTEEEVASMTELSLEQLLSVGIESSALSSGCYNTVISILMNQTQKPFTVVMDEFNCYYDHGQYFHMDYDENVRKGVPLNRITIFKPFLDAMGLYPEAAGTDISGGDVEVTTSEEAMMKWGSMIVGTSESRAVRRSFTQSLTDAASNIQSENDGKQNPLHVVEIRRFNNVEVQHTLYNFEITGVGRLRFDKGDTALNPEEVEYLRLVSGGSGQQLLDACMVRL